MLQHIEATEIKQGLNRTFLHTDSSVIRTATLRHEVFPMSQHT